MIANILFIVIDCLRAASCSAYGYERLTTPNIDRLARKSVLCRYAFTQSSFTLSSAASLMTGLYPEVHGAARYTAKLPDHIDTLPELLSRHGFRTTCYEGLTWFDGRWGLGRGFHAIESFRTQKRQRESGRITAIEICAKFMDDVTSAKRKQNSPHFSLLWFADAHTPYFIPEAQSHHFKQPNGQTRPTDRYDNAVRYVDGCVGELLSKLDASGQLDDTLAIITADHGDVFEEHYRLEGTLAGSFLHRLPFARPILARQGYPGHLLPPWDEVIHVPLIIKFPYEQFKGEVTEPVELIDLFRTIIDFLSLGEKTIGQGRSLMPLLKGERTSNERTVFSYTTMDEATATYTCALNKEFKYMKIYPPNFNLKTFKSGPKRYIVGVLESGEKLFKTGSDEKTDVSKEFPEQLSRMRKELQLWHNKNRVLKEKIRIHKTISSQEFSLPGSS